MKSATHPVVRHARRKRVGHLPRWQRMWTYVVFAVCAFSGGAYFLVQQFKWESASVFSHDLLVTHGVSTYLVLLAFGAVLPGHIRSAWNAQRNRVSGVAMVATLSMLALSGLTLYYGSEEVRNPALWLHWLIGGGILLVFPLHLIVGRRNQYRAGQSVPAHATSPGIVKGKRRLVEAGAMQTENIQGFATVSHEQQ